jgi:thioredoxin reductase
MKQVRIAIIGGGPIGLEAALEGAALGYDVTLYEAGRVGEHLRRFAWLTLFTPFSMGSTARGRERLRATGVPLPGDDEVVAAGDLVSRYLEPLSRLPELAGRIQEGARVSQIGREGLAKGDGILAVGDRSRIGRPFLLRVETREGEPRFDAADVVLDASGVYASPRATGPAGLPAIGEEHLGARVDRHLPPILDGARPRYARRRVLLVGGGHSAATALRDFETLAARGDAPDVTWVHPAPPSGGDPFPIVADDSLAERRALATEANRIAREAPWLTRYPGASVESYETWDGALRVVIANPDRSVLEVEVDRVLALVGYRPDPSLTRELQVHLCYASEGTMALASAVLAASMASAGDAGDCLKQAPHGAETLRNPEPGFFVIGAKSYGRNPLFLMTLGHRQIEDVFALVEADANAAEAPSGPGAGR